jgi:hypothetical protein
LQNKEHWQRYAAATAASYARKFLLTLSVPEVPEMTPVMKATKDGKHPLLKAKESFEEIETKTGNRISLGS